MNKLLSKEEAIKARREALLEAVEACKNAELEECVDLSDVLYNAACCACAASIEQLIKECK